MLHMYILQAFSLLQLLNAKNFTEKSPANTAFESAPVFDQLN